MVNEPDVSRALKKPMRRRAPWNSTGAAETSVDSRRLLPVTEHDPVHLSEIGCDPPFASRVPVLVERRMVTFSPDVITMVARSLEDLYTPATL